MNNIVIEDGTASVFIETVGKALNASVEYDQGIHCLTIPGAYGHGYFKSYEFDNGITVYEFDCTFEEELMLTFDKTIVQPLLLLFNREDTIKYINSAHTIDTSIMHLESLMVCAGVEGNTVFEIKKKEPTCLFAIGINRKDFEKKISTFLKEMDKELEVVFKDVNGVNHLYHKGYYSLDIAEFIEQFTTTELTGFMRNVFLEGKVYEILTHYFKQFLDDKNDPENRKILRQKTVDKIEEASNIIEDEMDVMGSIMNLAERVGLNQNTLQEGFKYLYKKSVNQYIRDVRMGKAKELMENTELNITEITYKIGINSRSYFSKLFKEKYGVSPKEYIAINRRSSNPDLSA